jgi:GNAT superfamily N-acetyltransferase
MRVFSMTTDFTIAMRCTESDTDFWAMRNMLVATAPITPIGLNWDVRRLDGQRFYEADLASSRLDRRPIGLWEARDDGLIGFVLAEGEGNAHLQVHPDYRWLESDMIDWAREHLSIPAGESSQRQLEIYVNEYDSLRQRLLRERGFEKTEYWGVIRHMRLGKQVLAQPQLTPGYTMRATAPHELGDCQRVADLLNQAFGRDFHNAQEYQNFTRFAPCFHEELDLAAIAPDGSFAAYVGIPYDEVNRRGIFEPVCTHPDHRQKGLAQALMREGLLRLREKGARAVTVDTGDMLPANRLYDSLGFTEAYRGFIWRWMG